MSEQRHHVVKLRFIVLCKRSIISNQFDIGIIVFNLLILFWSFVSNLDEFSCTYFCMKIFENTESYLQSLWNIIYSKNIITAIKQCSSFRYRWSWIGSRSCFNPITHKRMFFELLYWMNNTVECMQLKFLNSITIDFRLLQIFLIAFN